MIDCIFCFLFYSPALLLPQNLDRMAEINTHNTINNRCNKREAIHAGHSSCGHCSSEVLSAEERDYDYLLNFEKYFASSRFTSTVFRSFLSSARTIIAGVRPPDVRADARN